MIDGIHTEEQKNALAKEMMDALAFVECVDKLRADEGDSVEILCDNPEFDGHPNCAIVCCGDWTHFEQVRFDGDTVLECLFKALTVRTNIRPEAA